ncbi:MAG: DUF1365 domain-containing protein [Myxococcaceae bacterium]
MSASAIYLGRLSHVRHGPRRHAFSYRLYMFYLDLDELPILPRSTLFGVERARPLSFRRRDYLGDPGRPLKVAVLDEVERVLGERPEGPVRLLTLVRALGYIFNPVSFYYCFDRDGETLKAVVAEITNTPWGERHRYVVAGQGQEATARFPKAFHVSPFFPMEQTYEWLFSKPGDRLSVGMTNHQDGQAVFQASLMLHRHPFSPHQLARVALALPLMGFLVHAAIYLQAFRLWLKRVPFFPHPELVALSEAEDSR